MTSDSDMNYSQVVSQFQNFKNKEEQLNNEDSQLLFMLPTYYAGQKGPGKLEICYLQVLSGVPLEGISWSLVFKTSS